MVRTLLLAVQAGWVPTAGLAVAGRGAALRVDPAKLAPCLILGMRQPVLMEYTFYGLHLG